MATLIELSAPFRMSSGDLLALLQANIEEANRFGRQWDVVRVQAFRAEDGAPVTQVWGYASAYARTDGMGAPLTFVLTLTARGKRLVDVDVAVSSPYRKAVGPRDTSPYARRAHQVALRLLEFCVAPYEQIHPAMGRIRRLLGVSREGGNTGASRRRPPARRTT